jgi:hypothetical protein
MKGGPLAKAGTRLADLQGAVTERLDDAKALLDAGRYASAIAMAFYALEIQLKVVICRRLDLANLPRAFEIHDPEELLILAGLSQKIQRVKRPRAIRRRWETLLDIYKDNDFNDIRYVPNPMKWDARLARSVLDQLRDPRDGILPWLAKQR